MTVSSPGPSAAHTHIPVSDAHVTDIKSENYSQCTETEKGHEERIRRDGRYKYQVQNLTLRCRRQPPRAHSPWILTSPVPLSDHGVDLGVDGLPETETNPEFTGKVNRSDAKLAASRRRF